MSDSVKDKFSIAFSIVGMFASHAVGSLSVFFCAEITPTVIRCVWAAHGAVTGAFQGHWGCGGRCLPKLVNDPPALARVSGQGVACTGRPLGMDCCSTLTPRDPRIRAELKPGPSRRLEGRGTGIWRYKPHKRTWYRRGVGVPGGLPVRQPHQVLPTLLGFSEKPISERRVERALVFCWLRSRCLQSKERPRREKAQPVTSLICLTNTCWEPPHLRVPARQGPRAKTEWRAVF